MPSEFDASPPPVPVTDRLIAAVEVLVAEANGALAADDAIALDAALARAQPVVVALTRLPPLAEPGHIRRLLGLLHDLHTAQTAAVDRLDEEQSRIGTGLQRAHAVRQAYRAA